MADRNRGTLSRAVISGALVSLLSLSLMAPVAQADKLDDQKQKVEKQLDSLETDMEFLDADIQKTAERLKGYQDKLPAAQEKLSTARASVQSATDQVNELSARVDAAQASKDQISSHMVQDAEKMEDTRKAIGQIATQAYKRGGVSSNLSLMLNSNSDEGSLADSLGLANQALRSQNAVLSDLSQQQATDANVQARLTAVEEEISDLKGQAEAALVREQTARDEAEASKRHVDELIDGAQDASEELNAKRPQVKAQIKKQEDEHDQVVAEIKERQERLIREAAKRKRKEEAAKAAAEQAAKVAAEQAAERAAKAEAAARAKRAAAEKAAQANAADAAAKRAAADAADRKAASERTKSKKASTPAKKEPNQGSSGSSSSEPSSSTSSWGLSKPSSGGYITSTFGWRPTPAGTIDYGGRGGYVHAGLDWGFGGRCGSPVYAAAAGEVWYATMSPTSGNKVQISHGVVNGHALVTGYHHLSSYVVNSGQKVSKGQLVGYVGTTGNSTGCHLHFETILDGKVVNPAGLL